MCMNRTDSVFYVTCDPVRPCKDPMHAVVWGSALLKAWFLCISALITATQKVSTTFHVFTLQARQVQASAAGSIQLRILARLQNQAVATAWESWLQFHHRSKACRAIANRIRNKGLATAFNAWKDWSAQLSRARQLCKRVLGGALRQCFSAWEYAPELLLWLIALEQQCNVVVVHFCCLC